MNTRNIYIANVAGSSVWGTMRMPARQDNIYGMLCCKQKPIRRSIKTKLQVTMLIGLWFCGFLACQDFVVLGHNTLTIPEIF